MYVNRCHTILARQDNINKMNSKEKKLNNEIVLRKDRIKLCVYINIRTQGVEKDKE